MCSSYTFLLFSAELSHLAILLWLYLCVYRCVRDTCLRDADDVGQGSERRCPSAIVRESFDVDRIRHYFPDIDPDIIDLFVYVRRAIGSAARCTVDAPSWYSGRRITGHSHSALFGSSRLRFCVDRFNEIRLNGRMPSEARRDVHRSLSAAAAAATAAAACRSC